MFQLSTCCRSMSLILWTEKGLEMQDKNFRLLFHTISINTELPGTLNYVCWWYEVLLTCILFILPDYYQGPFDGKQHNLSIRKQAGPGKLNQEFGVLTATCVVFYYCTGILTSTAYVTVLHVLSLTLSFFAYSILLQGCVVSNVFCIDSMRVKFTL